MINRNLEALVHQLYDYWFVQLDFPDENGKPYKSSGGKMVWNERLKREIPAAWKTSKIGDFVNILDSQRIPLSNKDRNNRKGEFPYYGATGIMDYIDSFIFNDEIILLAEDGSTSDSDGHPIVQYVWGKVWVNNHAHIIKHTNPIVRTYLYYLLKDIPAKKIESGSIQKKISQANLCNYCVCEPPISIIEDFERVVRPTWEMLMNNTEEIISLQRQRDELLPLLINGQVSVIPTEVNCDLDSGAISIYT